MTPTFGQRCMARMIDAKKMLGALSSDDGAKIIDEMAKEEFGAKKQRQPRIPKAPGARNPLFDALALSTGCQDLRQITRAQCRAIGVALADIREVMPEVTPEEISARASSYRSKHRDWPLTAPALAKHWSEFGGERTRRAKLDPYLEPTNWRGTAENLWGKGVAENLSSVPWSEVSIALRADIVRASA